MRSAREQTLEAWRKGELNLLFTGRWPYFVESPYMAPSDIPTDFGQLVSDGLVPLSEAEAGFCGAVEDALDAICSDPEGLYCALTIFQIVVDDQRGRSLRLDGNRLAKRFGAAISALEPELRARHESWMGPTEETLWDRVVRACNIIREDTGLSLLPRRDSGGP